MGAGGELPQPPVQGLEGQEGLGHQEAGLLQAFQLSGTGEDVWRDCGQGPGLCMYGMETKIGWDIFIGGMS